MNKITVKNFFMMLLAGLLIIAMMVILGATAEENGVIYWLGLIIVCCSVIFILYETIQVSNKLNDTTNELNQLKEKLKRLVPPTSEDKTNENKEA